MEEYRLALRNLEQHYQDFLRDSQDSQMFGAEDRMQVESNYNGANRHYSTMVSSAEQGGRRRSRRGGGEKKKQKRASTFSSIHILTSEGFHAQMLHFTLGSHVFELTVAFPLQARHHAGQVRGFGSGAGRAVAACDWLHVFLVVVVLLLCVWSPVPLAHPPLSFDSLTSLTVALLLLCMENLCQPIAEPRRPITESLCVSRFLDFTRNNQA